MLRLVGVLESLGIEDSLLEVCKGLQEACRYHVEVHDKVVSQAC